MNDKDILRNNKMSSAMHEVTYDEQTKQRIKEEIEKYQKKQLHYQLFDFSIWDYFLNRKKHEYEHKENPEKWRKKERLKAFIWIGLHLTATCSVTLFTLAAFNDLVASSDELDQRNVRIEGRKASHFEIRVSGFFMMICGAALTPYLGYRGYKNAEKVYVMRPVGRIKINQREYS